MNFYKIAILVIDFLLIAGTVLIFFSFKKYLNAHKDESVEKNEKQLNSYVKKLYFLSGAFILLGIIVIVLGVLGKLKYN